uniref:Uncharacterized protein n=1 Tax=Anguilla anguilla TaxID=7936 RepID=A0A0E9Y0V8_ANGAN
MERSWSEVCVFPPDQTRHTTSAASDCGIGHQGHLHFFFGSIRGSGPLPRII